jgi:predicted RND superfamily exporter protein
MIMVMLEADDVINKTTLSRFEVLGKEFDKLEGVERVISPLDAQSIAMQDGFLLMDPLFETLPESQEDCENLKSKIGSNSMAKTFFSEDDFSVISMMLIMNTAYSDDLLVGKLDSVIAQNPGSEEVLMGGLPFIRYSIGKNINKDLIVLLPIALILMVLILYASFKEKRGFLLPFSVVVMSLLFSFGVMALLGWQISLITVLLPIMLIAIANNYGIHMISRYQELSIANEKMSMAQISLQIYTDLKRPIIVTALTTIGGILGLLTHTMVPAAQIGVLAALGIGFALMASIWFIPALLSYFKPLNSTKIARKKKYPLAERWLDKISKLVTSYPKRVVWAAIFLSVIGAAGIYYPS